MTHPPNRPVIDLANRLALLHVRHGVAFDAPTARDPSCVDLADRLVKGLRTADRDSIARVRGAVDPADLTDAAFWSTSLGRLLFAAGGYGADETIGQAFAAGVLGCTRQYVYELAAKGRLTRVGSPVMVRVDQVREMLKMRLDDLVK